MDYDDFFRRLDGSERPKIKVLTELARFGSSGQGRDRIAGGIVRTIEKRETMSSRGNFLREKSG